MLLAEGLTGDQSPGPYRTGEQLFATFVNKSPESLVGQSATNLPWIIGSDFGMAPPWQVALQQERPMANVMLQMRDSEGVVRTFMVNCSPVLGNGGPIAGCWPASTTSLCSKKQKGTARCQGSCRICQPSQKRIPGQHEPRIRTPMNAILGFADVLRRGLADTPRRTTHYLDTIHSSGRHLLELNNDILDLSKVEAWPSAAGVDGDPFHKLAFDVVEVAQCEAREKGISLGYESAGKDSGSNPE